MSGCAAGYGKSRPRKGGGRLGDSGLGFRGKGKFYLASVEAVPEFPWRTGCPFLFRIQRSWTHTGVRMPKSPPAAGEASLFEPTVPAGCSRHRPRGPAGWISWTRKFLEFTGKKGISKYPPWSHRGPEAGTLAPAWPYHGKICHWTARYTGNTLCTAACLPAAWQSLQTAELPS